MALRSARYILVRTPRYLDGDRQGGKTEILEADLGALHKLHKRLVFAVAPSTISDIFIKHDDGAFLDSIFK